MGKVFRTCISNFFSSSYFRAALVKFYSMKSIQFLLYPTKQSLFKLISTTKALLVSRIVSLLGLLHVTTSLVRLFRSPSLRKAPYADTYWFLLSTKQAHLVARFY